MTLSGHPGAVRLKATSSPFKTFAQHLQMAVLCHEQTLGHLICAIDFGAHSL